MSALADTLAPHRLPPYRGPVANPLPRLLEGHDLSADESELLFERLVLGRLTEAEIAALLVALRMKGETDAEMLGAARALRNAALSFPRPDYLFADCCGTGGDDSGLINVSTATAFVAAACGLPVAKHGNRSVSSLCGSADVLEALGARIEIEADASRRILDEVGFCFLFAPQYHPGMRHAGGVRRQLAVRTVMNLLGPSLNPARPPVQMIGVADPTKVATIARLGTELGVERTLVVHGSGLDEVALHGPTQVMESTTGELAVRTITPEQAGLARAPLSAVTGGDPATNAERLRALLNGGGSDAERGIVAINAAALLETAGVTPDLASGAKLAMDTLKSGRAGAVLRAYVEASHD